MTDINPKMLVAKALILCGGSEALAQKTKDSNDEQTHLMAVMTRDLVHELASEMRQYFEAKDND